MSGHQAHATSEHSMSFPPTVFLGAGQMAEALIRGVLRAGLLSPAEITATDIRPTRLELLGRELGIRCCASNIEGVSHGRLLVVAVKPQDVPALLTEIGPHLRDDQVLASIAAGVPTARIEQALGRPIPVVRVMPNTPALVGAGVAAVAAGRWASAEQTALVQRLMAAVGQAIVLPETQLDAVTGLSGSGPAFVAMVIEALIDGGVRVGLPRDVATTLAIQTVLGTAQMLRDTSRHPAALKDMVTSPGGTTIAGVHALERGGLRAALIDAVVAATERSRQLGGG